jgi:hypothetical protein
MKTESKFESCVLSDPVCFYERGMTRNAASEYRGLITRLVESLMCSLCALENRRA